jgi:hypothetical protein
MNGRTKPTYAPCEAVQDRQSLSVALFAGYIQSQIGGDEPHHWLLEKNNAETINLR